MTELFGAAAEELHEADANNEQSDDDDNNKMFQHSCKESP